MGEQGAFNQRIKTTGSYALMLIGLYFIVAAVNGFFNSNWEIGGLFGIIGLVMFIIGYIFTKPRLSILHLVGFTSIGVGIWTSFRSISGLFVKTEAVYGNSIVGSTTVWQIDANIVLIWGAVSVACLFVGWLLLSGLLNSRNRRMGALLMIVSGIIFAFAVNISAVQSIISLLILLVSITIFAQGYKIFIKKT